MQIPDLFQVLAEYLSFVADFLGLRGMDHLARKESVDTALASYFVTGVFVAYLFSTAKRFPGYEWLLRRTKDRVEDKAVRDPDKPVAAHASDMARYVIVSILGAVLMHGLLVASSWLSGGPPILGLKATMNASLAGNAVYHPLNAIIRRIQALLDSGRSSGLLRPRSSGALRGLLGLIPILFTVHWVFAFATVHGTTFWSMAALFGVSLAAFLLLAVVVVLALVDARDDAPKEPSRAAGL